MTLYPVEHMKVTHRYATSPDKWQDFTGDLTGVTINMRELGGTHTASMSFYNAAMDPSQGTTTRVVNKGDLVNVWIGNAAGRRLQLAQFTITKVGVAIDLTKRVGKQNLVTISMSAATVGVAGSATGGGSG